MKVFLDSIWNLVLNWCFELCIFLLLFYFFGFLGSTEFFNHFFRTITSKRNSKKSWSNFSRIKSVLSDCFLKTVHYYWNWWLAQWLKIAAKLSHQRSDERPSLILLKLPTGIFNCFIVAILVQLFRVCFSSSGNDFSPFFSTEEWKKKIPHSNSFTLWHFFHSSLNSCYKADLLLLTAERAGKLRLLLTYSGVCSTFLRHKNKENVNTHSKAEQL